MSEQDAELLNEFKVEAEEHLSGVEPQLLEMEGADDARREELVHGIFRAVHSVKGASGFFGLDQIQSLSHSMESLLMRVRDGELPFRDEMTDAVLRGLDKLQEMIDALPEVVEPSIESEVETFQRLTRGEAEVAPSADEPPEEAVAEVVAEEAAKGGSEPRASHPAVTEQVWKSARAFGQSVFILRIPAAIGADPEVLEAVREALLDLGEIVHDEVEAEGGEIVAKTVLAKELLVAELPLTPECVVASDPDASPLAAPTEESAPAPSDDASAQKPEPELAAPAAPEPPPAAKPESKPGGGSSKSGARPAARENETIRVNVSLLDKLMDLAGELVLSRNQLLRSLADTAEPATKTILQDLDLITSELQGDIMNTRMQPVGLVFNKFNRIVRDLSKKLGKKARLELSGTEVELDKSILELLSDPLTHLIRNALDHGLEEPEERAAAGKAPEGAVKLRAFHEGGQVHIEIEDDGRGIDPDKMRSIAVERGIHTREEAELISDAEARAIIFAPGFSTAAQVSDVSGRGVGMDVVKTNIAKLGGKIDIDSEVGMGSILRIRLPLTLAIIPSLIVKVADQRYAIPQVNLVELVRVKLSEGSQSIKRVRGAPVLDLRGRLLPLVQLRKVLDLEVAPDGETDGAVLVVVLRIGEAVFGLVVDAVADSEEIVVKPLSRMLEDCGIYAGAAIMGDGHPAMILDAGGLASHVELDLNASNTEIERADTTTSLGTEKRQLVVFTNAESERFAVDLGRLVRLEKIHPSAIEKIGNDECIQYRGRGLPLARLESRLPVRPLECSDDQLFVLIPRTSGKARGLLAGKIIDTIETTVELERSGDDCAAIAGRSVIDGKLTIVLDTDALLETMEAA